MRTASVHAGAAGRDVTVYLRPEDVLARPIAPGDDNVFEGQIQAIEFLGALLPGAVAADALGDARHQVYLSLNFLAEQALAVGSSLPLRLLPERMRVFSPERGRAAPAPSRASVTHPTERRGARSPALALVAAAAAGLPGAPLLRHPAAGRWKTPAAASSAWPTSSPMRKTPALLESLWNSLWVSALVTPHRAHGLLALPMR
jgi:hypothetical protein